MKNNLFTRKTALSLFFFAVALGALAQSSVTKVPVLKVSGGQIQGVFNDDRTVTIYKGVPYAAPPVGSLRWVKPQPVVAWKGVRKADRFSNMAFQRVRDMKSFYGKEFHDPESEPQRSEDCLYLNVWTPSSAAGRVNKKLPVVMWIHGGAYMSGFGFEKEMDGEAWANHGVILVTINYRLGAFGFLCHPAFDKEQGNVSGNFGLYDQIAALKWIKDNIAQFGGDPNNITVAGQSAGAGSVKNLVTSPLSRNMISKAIIQSGGGLGGFLSGTTSKTKLEQLGEGFMTFAGAKNITELRAMPAAKIDSLGQKYMWSQKAGLFFTPYVDGTVLDEDFTSATFNNHLADIPYLIGCNANDMGNMTPEVERFCQVRDSISKKPVYMYHFDRALPGDTAGAFHSAEMWYTFHTLKRSWRPFTKADYGLSDRMVTFWTNFIKNGNPGNGWQAYTRKNPYIQILQTIK